LKNSNNTGPKCRIEGFEALYLKLYEKNQMDLFKTALDEEV
jgi:hypothetical protein